MPYGVPTTAVGTVVGVIVSLLVPVAVALACEAAVMVALLGRPKAIAGAVYRPVEEMLPAPVGDTDQFTAVLLLLVTVAVNCVV
jgi:hypothetical protein